MTPTKIILPERVKSCAGNFVGQIYLATGCFDVLHRGHVELLEHAAALAKMDGARSPCVWVGINSDRAVRSLKGESRPINTWYDRAVVVAALHCVHRVFQIDDVKVKQAIIDVIPCVWIKGGDYTMETLDKSEVNAARSLDTEIVLYRSTCNQSTSKILEKI